MSRNKTEPHEGGIVIRPNSKAQEEFLTTDADIAVYGGSAGSGKRLKLSTPVPTPDGWKTMGEIRDGDLLFTERGGLTRVVKAHPVEMSVECYRLTFDDGEQIECCVEHLWHTYTAKELCRLTKQTPEWRAARRARRKSRSTGRRSAAFTAAVTARNQRLVTPVKEPPVGGVKTTGQIVSTLRLPSGRANHAIQVAIPVCLPESQLPMDPYLFGVWLGDGTSVSGTITTTDPEIVQAFRDGGYEVYLPPSQKIVWRVSGLSSQLRRMGVLGNKHVPAAYLRGSIEQRKALLQGLMDTDGCVCLPSGSVEFTNTNLRLAQAVHELAVSLGCKAQISEGRATLYGRDCGPKYRISFSPSFRVFRLPRKLALQKVEGHRRTTKWRYIVSTERVESQPMRCLTVDNPTGLFLVGRNMVPTHNTFCLLMDTLRWIGDPNFRGVLFRLSYQDILKAGSLWDKSMEIYPLVGGKPKVGNLEWTFPSGARVEFGYLAQDQDVFNWHGSEVPWIGIDEGQLMCLTAGHEVLTSTGWKLIGDVSPGEKVASLSKDRQIEYRSVLNSTSRLHEGPMVRISQPRGINVFMTPDHRVVIDSGKHNDTIRFVRAQELLNLHCRIPRTGEWVGEEIGWMPIPKPSGRGIGRNSRPVDGLPMDDWLEFLGWFLSEGCVYNRGSRSGPVVIISQQKPSESLDRLMKRLPWRSHKNEKEYRIWSRQLYGMLDNFGDCYKKRIPRWLFGLSVRQQSIFFDAFVAGDGSRNGEGITIRLCNSGLVDDLQEMATLIGRTATKAFSTQGPSSLLLKNGADPGRKYSVWTLTVSQPRRKSTQVSPRWISTEDYRGAVYCLQVEKNENFFVRYNGRCFVTGNSPNNNGFRIVYMLSRNRSVSARIKPSMRISCNPDADSWLATFLSWWIDQETGYPIKARAGKIRYWVKCGDRDEWADRPEELYRFIPEVAKQHVDVSKLVKSVTFIPAKIYDNVDLLRNNPEYLGNLLSQSPVERERLLEGNWLIRPQKGNIFDASWFEIIPPANVDHAKLTKIRSWDLAASDPKKLEDPDWTVGLLLGKNTLPHSPENPDAGMYYILDIVRLRGSPLTVEKAILQTAEQDGRTVPIIMEEEPGSSGKIVTSNFRRLLDGYHFIANKVTGPKDERAKPVASQAQGGFVKIVRAAWNRDFLSEIGYAGSGYGHDDQCLIAETQVQTLTGCKAISSIRAGEFVLTRTGWRAVEVAAQTAARQVWEAVFDDGSSLCGSASHPVWSEGEWVDLSDLVVGSEVLTCQKSRSLSIEEESFGVTQTRQEGTTAYIFSAILSGKNRLFSFIVKSGKTLTDLFRKVVSFTTRTTILSTMISAISNVLLIQSTKRFTPSVGHSQPKPVLLTLKKFGQWLPTGIGLRKVGHGIGNTLGESLTIYRPMKQLALSVAGNSQPNTELQLSALRDAGRELIPENRKIKSNGIALSADQYSDVTRTVAIPLARKRVLAVQRLNRVEQLYNLKVEHDNEYFANGVLVHNCDALSQAHGYLAGPVKKGGIVAMPIRLEMEVPEPTNPQIPVTEQPEKRLIDLL